MKRIHLLLLACLCSVFSTYAAEPQGSLGKLFLTPEKRLSLDRQRQFNLSEDDGDGSDTLQLDGVVQRSSGRNSVWINHRMQADREKGVGVRLENNRPGAAELKLENEAPTRLKVGESVNRNTQVRKDIIAPGAVSAGRP